jgi:hypothetical protein
MGEQTVKNSKRVKLEYPITIGEEDEIKSVQVYRLKVKHMKALPKELLEKLAERGEEAVLTIEEALPILEVVTSLTKEQIDELDIADFKRIQETIGASQGL